MISQSLEEKVDTLLTELGLMRQENHQLKNMVEKYIRVAQANIKETILTHMDLAERYSISRGMFHLRPWLWPNFGISDFPTGYRRWRLSTVLDWEEKSEKERKAEWLALSEQEREHIIEQARRRSAA